MLRTLVCFLAILGVSSPVVADQVSKEVETEFEGYFSQVISNGPECDKVFAVTEYHATHIRVSPNHLTSILHFRNMELGGFFDEISLIGSFGGSNDVLYEKPIRSGELEFRVTAGGMMETSFVFLDFEVAATDSEGQVVCQTWAEYSGFAR